MAKKAISQLPAATPLTGAEVFPVVQSGVTVQAPLNATADYAVKTATSFVQTGASSVPRTTQSKLREWVSVKDKGAVGDGVANDTAAILAVLAEHEGGIYFPPGTYKVNANIPIAVGKNWLFGNNAKLDFSTLASGFAVSLIPHTIDTYNQLPVLDGIQIIGPRSEASNADGVEMGRPISMGDGNTAWTSFNNVRIEGFRDNLVLGAQTWLNTFINIKIGFAWRYGIDFITRPNAGENINFHGGVIYDCRNAGTTGLGLHFYDNSNTDVNFFGTSFDYNDKDGLIQSGVACFSNCFFENGGALPKFTVVSFDGKEPARLVIAGGTFKKDNPALGHPEPAGGRVSFIDISHNNSSVIIRDLLWNRFALPNTQLVRVTSALPYVLIEGTDPVSLTRGDAPYVSKSTNPLVNGDFGTDVSNWTTADTGTGTVTVLTWDGADGAEGALGCARVVGTDANRGRTFFQRIPCEPRRKLLVRFSAKALGLTNGRIVLRIGPETFSQSQFTATQELHYIGVAAPAGQISVNGSGNTVSSDNGWVTLANIFSPPNGCNVARVEVLFENFVGTGKLDNCYAWSL